jgi:hypothetical protein
MAKSLQDMDQLQSIHWATIRKQSEIPLLIQVLASPRPDGQFSALFLQFHISALAQIALNAIKEVGDKLSFVVNLLVRGQQFTKSPICGFTQKKLKYEINS